MSRYAIWNKTDNIITPVGEVLTPAQWIERYPVAGVLDTVCAGETVNGAFFGVYDQMVAMYASDGCDFSECETQRDHLDAIEAFEDARNAPAPETISAEERIAAALEAQVLMSMPDEEEEL